MRPKAALFSILMGDLLEKIDAATFAVVVIILIKYYEYQLLFIFDKMLLLKVTSRKT